MITWGLAGGFRGSLKTLKCLVDFYDFVVQVCSVVSRSDGRDEEGESAVGKWLEV